MVAFLSVGDLSSVGESAPDRATALDVSSAKVQKFLENPKLLLIFAA